MRAERDSLARSLRLKVLFSCSAAITFFFCRTCADNTTERCRPDPSSLNHCANLQCVRESAGPIGPAAGLGGSKQPASVNTSCVCILGPLCGEFRISQVTTPAARSPSGDQGHPAGGAAGTMKSQIGLTCCLRVTRKQLGPRSRRWQQGDGAPTGRPGLLLPPLLLLLLLQEHRPSQATYSFLSEEGLWARLQKAPPSPTTPPHPPDSTWPLPSPRFPTPTFCDGVRLDDAAGAVGCADGRVGGAGAHRGREEELQLLDTQQGDNHGLNKDRQRSRFHYIRAS